VLSFCTKNSTETSVFPVVIHWNIIINIPRGSMWSVWHFCPTWTKLAISWQILIKVSTVYKNSSGGNRVVLCGQTDRQDKVQVAFRCFLNVPHKHVLFKALSYPQRNRDNVVGVVTRPRVKWSEFRIPERAKVFLISKTTHINSGVYPSSYSVCTGFFPGGKMGWSVDHPASSGAEVKKRVELYLHNLRMTPCSWQGKFHTIYIE
jgi:hypothetical protein